VRGSAMRAQRQWNPPSSRRCSAPIFSQRGRRGCPSRKRLRGADCGLVFAVFALSHCPLRKRPAGQGSRPKCVVVPRRRGRRRSESRLPKRGAQCGRAASHRFCMADDLSARPAILGGGGYMLINSPAGTSMWRYDYRGRRRPASAGRTHRGHVSRPEREADSALVAR